MAKPRDPRREKAFGLWKASNGAVDLVEIAKCLGVSPGTVRGWKSKDNWNAKMNGTQVNKERNVPQRSEKKIMNTEHVEPPQVMDDFTDKRRIFVLEYLRDFNATRAAIAAGYSKRSAYAEGWRLLRNDEVQAELKRLKEMHTLELGLSIQRIIAEYMKIAFADITDVAEFGRRDVPIFDDEGKLVKHELTGEVMTVKENYLNFKNAHEIDGTVISEIKQGKNGVSVKLHDKIRALDKLERYTDYMTDEEKLRMEKTRLEIEALKEKGW